MDRGSFQSKKYQSFTKIEHINTLFKKYPMNKMISRWSTFTIWMQYKLSRGLSVDMNAINGSLSSRNTLLIMGIGARRKREDNSQKSIKKKKRKRGFINPSLNPTWQKQNKWAKYPLKRKRKRLGRRTLTSLTLSFHTLHCHSLLSSVWNVTSILFVK